MRCRQAEGGALICKSASAVQQGGQADWTGRQAGGRLLTQFCQLHPSTHPEVAPQPVAVLPRHKQLAGGQRQGGGLGDCGQHRGQGGEGGGVVKLPGQGGWEVGWAINRRWFRLVFGMQLGVPSQMIDSRDCATQAGAEAGAGQEAGAGAGATTQT
jgi:hypothetical protein